MAYKNLHVKFLHDVPGRGTTLRTSSSVKLYVVAKKKCKPVNFSEDLKCIGIIKMEAKINFGIKIYWNSYQFSL